MNKLYGDGVKGAWLTCILEPGNFERLQHHEPIEFELNDGPWKNGLPPKITIVIAYSETPIRDARELAKLVPTVEDRRTPVSESKRPHCQECKSTIEQLGVWRSDQSPMWLVFCPVCGCVFGTTPPIMLEQKP